MIRSSFIGKIFQSEFNQTDVDFIYVAWWQKLLHDCAERTPQIGKERELFWKN